VVGWGLETARIIARKHSSSDRAASQPLLKVTKLKEIELINSLTTIKSRQNSS
jgi:hypothetical protein